MFVQVSTKLLKCKKIDHSQSNRFLADENQAKPPGDEVLLFFVFADHLVLLCLRCSETVAVREGRPRCVTGPTLSRQMRRKISTSAGAPRSRYPSPGRGPPPPRGGLGPRQNTHTHTVRPEQKIRWIAVQQRRSIALPWNNEETTTISSTRLWNGEIRTSQADETKIQYTSPRSISFTRNEKVEERQNTHNSGSEKKQANRGFPLNFFFTRRGENPRNSSAS